MTGKEASTRQHGQGLYNLVLVGECYIIMSNYRHHPSANLPCTLSPGTGRDAPLNNVLLILGL